MLPKFFDRERELEWLESIYSETGFKLAVIYGRRRVGKTELIKQFIKDKKGVYILSTDESLEENIKSFKEKFYKITKKDYFQKLHIVSFYDLFKYLTKEIDDEKIVVAIDEFPYLLSLKKGILSLFQKIIDENLIDTNIKLIICGSSMSMMENDVLGYKSPLYGRNISSWKLSPFNFKEVSKIVDNIEKACEVYFIYGGVPYYLRFYNKNKGLMENIISNFLTKGRNLYDEPLILLREEFRESRVYRLILKYISLGYKSLGKLCSATGLEKSNLSKYLSSLEEVGIIRHVIPLGMKRKGIYEVSDPLFRFWFKFVYPYRDKLEIGNIESVEKLIYSQLNAYFGYCFEYLIEERLTYMQIPELENFTHIYKWWYKDKEIDVVGLNNDTKEILFVECKWQNKVDARKTIKELGDATKYVKWYNDERKESYALFAKDFKEKINKYNGKKVYCFDLKDLMKK